MESFKWLTLDRNDLENDDVFLDAKSTFLDDTGLKGLINISDREALMKFIQAFSKARTIQLDEDDFFLTKKHRLAFCILKHGESDALDKELGISRINYIDHDEANTWKRNLVRIFHPDKNDTEFKASKEVTSKINLMYKRMLGKA